MKLLKASTDYGTRFILYLAEKGDVCSSRQASEDMAIPRDYLIQLATRMRQSGIVKAKAGKDGGYYLAVPPEDITVARLLDFFEEYGVQTRSLVDPESADEHVARVMEMHDSAVTCLTSYLSLITVQDLLDASHGEVDLEKRIAEKMIATGQAILDETNDK